MKKIILILVVFVFLHTVSKAHASLLWYAMGSSSGRSACTGDYMDKYLEIAKKCRLTAVGIRNEELVFICVKPIKPLREHKEK